MFSLEIFQTGAWELTNNEDVNYCLNGNTMYYQIIYSLRDNEYCEEYGFSHAGEAIENFDDFR